MPKWCKRLAACGNLRVLDFGKAASPGKRRVSCIAPAEDNALVTLIPLGALILSPFIVVALLGTLSTLLATYGAGTFLSTALA